MTELLGYALALVVALGASWWIHVVRLRHGAERAAAAAAARDQEALLGAQSSELEETAASMKKASEMIGDLATKLEAAAERQEPVERELVEARGKVDRYFRSISTIERERNEWLAAYEKAVSGHSNAQAMMIDELSRLGRRMSRAVTALEAMQEPPDEVKVAIALLTTTVKEQLLEVAKTYKRDNDPETGAGAAIERSKLDLTPDEVQARQSSPQPP